MTGATTATSDSYFAEQWGRSDDPWAHGTRWYEERKYGLTVAALPRRLYRCAFEPGCGAGFLTVPLAARADRLVAMEREERGASVTTARCADAGLSNVEVRTGRIPADWPDEPFDLLVLSEVLYYLDDDDLAAALGRADAALARGADVVAVHFRPEVPEHARRGDEVHAALTAVLGPPGVHHEEALFVLEAFAGRD